MYPAKFAYVRTASLEEATDLLRQHDGDAKVIAGGHSLLPLMKLRLAQPRLLVDIGRVPGLDYVRVDGDQLAIGALATYRRVMLDEQVRGRVPVLAEACEVIGDQQVRARGTIAGSLAHADPAADMPAVVLALGGSVRTVGPDGGREIDLDDFFVDMLTTALGETELIAEVRLALPGPRSGAAYEKFEQPASHYALAGACAVVTLDDSGRIERARVGITGVGVRAYRPMAVEEALAGRAPDDEAGLAEAVQTATEGVDVQGDIHAGPEYRAHLARVLARRAVQRAAGRAASRTG